MDVTTNLLTVGLSLTLSEPLLLCKMKLLGKMWWQQSLVIKVYDL